MGNIGKLLALVKPYRAEALLSLVMLCALVLMDLALPRLIQRIVDEGIGHNDRQLVIHTALQMLGLSVLSTFAAIANNHYSVRVGEAVARDLRENLFLKIQRYSFGNLDRQKTGELLVRLTSDVAAIKGLTQISLRIGTRAPLLMLGSAALMISTSRRLAFTLLPLLLVTSVLIGYFVTRVEPLYRIVQQKRDVVNTVLQENIAGARIVKALVRGEYENTRFEAANEDLTQRSTRVMQRMAAMTPQLTMCINLGVTVVIWSGGLQAIKGELSLGQIVAFVNYLLTTMTPLVMMTMLSTMWAAGFASLARLGSVLDSVPDVVDHADAITLSASARPDVSFNNVGFSYASSGGAAVLTDISFEAQKGKTVAILGSTGAGKSTLVNLIPRLYDVSAGSVTAFETDVRDVTQESLVSRIGFVPQESLLFSGTVRDNIRYGRPDASAAEVINAAQVAQAHAFISQMPEGYDSRIEQRGANLSGGQKQRLAIARALLLKPEILILDDSTSAVDVETETKIQQGLGHTAAERTTFVVAQRISTVLDADLILVLDKGRVAAQGTHRELLTSSAIYREIYDSQLGAGPSASDSSVPPKGHL